MPILRPMSRDPSTRCPMGCWDSVCQRQWDCSLRVHHGGWCPIGDGSIQYSIQALWTAVQHKVPVIVIVLENGDYSALKSFCDFTQVGRNVAGMDIPGIDMVKIAEGYGMTAEQVDRPEDLEPALKQAFASQKPHLISVSVAKGGEKCMGMDQSANPPKYG